MGSLLSGASQRVIRREAVSQHARPLHELATPRARLAPIMSETTMVHAAVDTNA
jgi:hypothetical protein